MQYCEYTSPATCNPHAINVTDLCQKLLHEAHSPGRTATQVRRPVHACASPLLQPPHAACNPALSSNTKASTRGDSPRAATAQVRRPVYVRLHRASPHMLPATQHLAATQKLPQRGIPQEQQHHKSGGQYMCFSIAPAPTCCLQSST